MAAVDGVEPADGSLAGFLERTSWVIDLGECAAEPTRYSGLTLPPWVATIPSAWIVVPLSSAGELVGFVILSTPRARIELDWEVRDLLKTASRQAASYLRHVSAAEALLEARKFDAFNRMSAFVVHDLKNLVAQLSLMLRNAERHRNNPEFQRDMLATVQNVVEHMNKLMLQLRTGTTPVEKPRPVDLESVVRRVASAKRASRAAIGLDLTPATCALGHEDRLEHVIGHLVQNAQDATAERGEVSVRLFRESRTAVIEIADTGIGMSPEFIRDRLFKPFETTKTAGMGIGVYESSQYVTESRGSDHDRQHARRRHAGSGACCRSPMARRASAGSLRESHESDGAGAGMTEAHKPLLIVEDDPALQKQMCWAFDGYETIVADDRESAIAHAPPPRAGGRDDGPRPAASVRTTRPKDWRCSTRSMRSRRTRR